MRRLQVFAAVVVALVAVDAAAQYCPSNPPPDEKDRRPKKRDQDDTCSRSKVGDPVVVTGTNPYTFDRLEDFFIPTAHGGLTFYRTYYSNDKPWKQWSNGEVKNVPTPFGKSPHDGDSLRWVHNLFSFVDLRPNGSSGWTTVRPPVGTYEKFGNACSPAPCWVPLASDSPGQPSRLQRTAKGFEYSQDDGKRYVYEAVATGNQLFFLSKIVAPSGDEVATIAYAAPAGLGCPSALGAVPYISEVNISGGPQLRFSYANLTRTDGITHECVLSGIAANDGSSTVPLTTYTYLASGGAPRPGKLASVQTPQYTEEFDYTAEPNYTGGFKVKQNGQVVVSHRMVGDNVVSLSDYLGELSIPAVLSSGSCNGQWNAQYCCTLSEANQRTVTTSAGRGDGTWGPVNFEQTFRYVGGRDTWRHGPPKPIGRDDACPSNSDSCSTGSITWLWDNAALAGPGPGTICSQGNPAYVSGTKNKANHWTMTPHAVSTNPAAQGRLEQTYELRGIASGTGGGGGGYACSPNCPQFVGTGGGGGGAWENAALEWTKYEYQYPNGTQRVSKEIQPSAISGTKETEYRLDAQGRVIATVTTGQTRDITGATQTKWRATFVTYDAQGRPLRREGPCFLQIQSAMACPGARPVIDYSYHGTGNGFSTGRLKDVTRYPTACVPGSCTGGLTTTFGDYTALGEPGSVSDKENSVKTTYTYVGSQVATKTVDGKTWSYTWDTEKLVALQNPDGDFEVFSYRDPSTNAWLGRLMWKAKAGDAAGDNWSEKLEYEYWPDGTVKLERARCNTALSSQCPGDGVRWERHTAADAERRQTWATSTGFATGQADVKGYDGANNVSRIGRAFNSPPAFCRTAAGADSDLCTLLEFDRAERLAKVVETPGGSAPVSTTCLDYDKQGNVTRVLQGCTSGASCSMSGGASTCSSATPEARYQHDDFGNVIEVRLPNTRNAGGTDYGVIRSEFDAQGNVIKRQDETQRANPNNVIQKFQYDALGRLTLAQQQWLSTNHEQYRLWHDGAGPTVPSSCPAPSNTMGRVRMRQDPVWSTWYQYSAEGRVLKEVRVRTPGDWQSFPACGANPDESLETAYTYTANGDLASITYPHGRTVSFAHGDRSWGQADRVVQVLATRWLGYRWSPDAQVLLDSVVWEPYGGLRGYAMGLWRKGPNDWMSTEYLMGSAASVPSKGCVDAEETPDLSGRLRSVWVSWGAQDLGNGSGDLFNRTYSWTADQVARMDTCYLADFSNPQVDDYRNLGGGLDGYDRLLRLKSASNPAMSTAGGLYQRRQYGYSSRGNLESITINQNNDVWQLHYDTNVRQVDRLLRMQVSRPGSRLWNEFEYDQDGRVSRKRWPNYDDLGAGPYVDLGYLNDDFGPGGDSTIRNIQTSAGVTYTYYYDVENKRVRKQYPTDVVDEYFYDLSKNLLEDRGNVSTAGGEGYSLDEYVWLGGRPVAVFRSGFDKKWNRVEDLTGTCTRNGEPAECDVYFPVTDHLGKPVVTVNSQGEVSGVGEYEPYGMMNRADAWDDTGHPYANGASRTMVDHDFKLLGMKLDARAHFNQLDTEAACGGGLWDWVVVKDGVSGAEVTARAGGVKQGDAWTGWGHVPSGRVKVSFYADGVNCPPGDCLCWNGTAYPYSGAALKEVELRRYQSTNWYFPPLRFPGQYFDAETDLHENWNRFYDPQTGRYLSPEPMLQSPAWVNHEAASGFTTPTYAYARNSPVRYTDPTGLFSWKMECPDIGGVERGFALQKTVFGRRWSRTSGSVGLDNPLQSACDDLKIAEAAQQQMISNQFSLLAGSCWANMVREIRAACDKEKKDKCGSPGSPPEPSAEPPPGYADR